MKNDKMIQFVKRWRDLERRQKDLDFERSVFARDLRAEFEPGRLGDDEFVNWCVVELGLTAAQARSEFLPRAQAAIAVPDVGTWNQLGGFRQTRHLVGLTKKQQVDVVQAAKVSNKVITTVRRERGLNGAPPISKPAPRVWQPVATSTSPAVIIRRTANLSQVAPANDRDPTQAEKDAIALVQYIARTCKNIPRDIIKIMTRYAQAEAA